MAHLAVFSLKTENIFLLLFICQGAIICIGNPIISFERICVIMTKQKLLIIIIVAVLAVAIPVGLVVGFGGNQATPAQQYIKIEGDALHSLVNSMGGASNSGNSAVSTSTIDVIPSEALFAMLGLQGADMSWAEKVTLKMDNKVNGLMLNSLMNVGMNGKTIVIADLITNSSTGLTYLAIPTLSDRYLKVDQNSVTGGSAGSAATVSGLLSQLKIPETATVKALLNKYIDIALSNMTQVEKTTQDMTVSGKTQSVTVYANYITEKVFTDIIKDVLNEIKTDKDIKAALPEGVEIGEAIDALLASLSTDPSEDKDDAIVLSTYVNGKNEVIGRALSVDRKITLSYLTLSDSKGSVSEFSVAMDDVKYTLTGNTASAGGTYSLALTSGEQTLVLASLTYTVNGQSGSCELKLSDFIEQNIFGSTEIDPTVKINWSITNSGNTADIDLYLFMMSQQIIGIETSSSALQGDANITLPGSSTDITDSQQLASYLSSLNFDALEQNMRAAGIPSGMVNAIMAKLPGSGK